MVRRGTSAVNWDMGRRLLMVWRQGTGRWGRIRGSKVVSRWSVPAVTSFATTPASARPSNRFTADGHGDRVRARGWSPDGRRVLAETKDEQQVYRKPDDPHKLRNVPGLSATHRYENREMERETRFELATSCLEGKRSTTELLPPAGAVAAPRRL